MKKYSLFSVFGIELEYMIVNKDTLEISPHSDELFFKKLGEYIGEYENGIVSWSNELVMHVIELKTTQPESTLSNLTVALLKNITEINSMLAKDNAMLLPTAAHPFYNPAKLTKLWPHDSDEVYRAYNKIFDCKGHGWANLQSVHLNLPFANENEFVQLHAAIRLVLPIMAALSASSPIIEEKITGIKDTRLEYYRTNQQKVPVISGDVIPEPMHSFADYEKLFEKITTAIAPFNDDDVLEAEWVNSRGAIARFIRDAIEIRVLDIQETPVADLAICQLITNVLKLLAQNAFGDLKNLIDFPQASLVKIFMNTLRHAEAAVIDDADYLKIWGIQTSNATAQTIWQTLYEKTNKEFPYEAEFKQALNVILQEGTLSTRILKTLGNSFNHADVINVYQKLARCLREGVLFQCN